MFNGVTVLEVRDLYAALSAQVGRLVPGEVPLPDVPAMWGHYDGIERLASAAKTLLAERVDESRVWAREGHRSPADYMARQSGSSVGAARGALDTSRKLRDLPETQAALRRGRLSRAQAEAVTDAAAANPGAERRLLGAAQRSNLTELRDECNRAKAAADGDADARYRRIHAERRLRQWTDAQGAWNALLRGTPDAGARFNAVLQPIIEELFAAARRAGRHQPRDAYAYDALIELARRAHTHPNDHRDTDDDTEGDTDTDDTDTDTDDTDTGDTDTDDIGDLDVEPDDTDTADTGDTGEPDVEHDEPDDTDDTGDLDQVGADPAAGKADDDGATASAAGSNRRARRRTRTASRRRQPTYQALLRLDYQALVRGHIEGDELCEITGLGPIPVPVARDLLGDAVLKLVITKGVDVAHVTHLGRGPNAAQHLALLWSSPTCIVEGCSDIRVQRDHRVPWSDCHETRLDNIDPECRWHHHLKTHQDWALLPGVGKREMVPPHDPRHPNNSPPHQPAEPAHAQPTPEQTPPQHTSTERDAGRPESADSKPSHPTLFGDAA